MFKSYNTALYSECCLKECSLQGFTLEYGMKDAVNTVKLQELLRSTAQSKNIAINFGNSSVGYGKNWFQVTFGGVDSPISGSQSKGFAFALQGNGLTPAATRMDLENKINRLPSAGRTP